MPDISFSAEPAIWVALANAALLVAVSFGLPVTNDQKVAVDTLLGALLAVGAGVVIRSRVTPVAAMIPPPH